MPPRQGKQPPVRRLTPAARLNSALQRMTKTKLIELITGVVQSDRATMSWLESYLQIEYTPRE